MTELSQIVQLSISANSTTPSRTGFGSALVLAYHARFPERYRVYTDLAGMTSDGFANYEPAYRKAAAAFSQNPAITQVVVGRLPSAPSFTQTVTITSAVEGQHVKLKVIDPTSGTVNAIDYTILAAATTTTVATAVELLIEAVTGVASTSSSAVITVTPASAGQFPYIYDLENCTLEETTADADYDDELSALQLETDDWYFVHTDSSSPANTAKVAAWVLASSSRKMYSLTSSSAGELAGTGTLGSSIKALTNTRTFGLWAPNLHECGDMGFTGVIAPNDPGSYTAAFKTIAGLTPKALTATQRVNLETDNWNHYQTVAGVSITRPGKTFGGEWIDIVHGIDALEARIQEDVYALLVNAKKVSHRTKGYDLVASAILGALKAFEGDEALLVKGSSRVILPTTVSTGDRTAREYNGVRFTADLNGAIHFVSIVGTLSNS